MGNRQKERVREGVQSGRHFQIFQIVFIVFNVSASRNLFRMLDFYYKEEEDIISYATDQLYHIKLKHFFVTIERSCYMTVY